MNIPLILSYAAMPLNPDKKNLIRSSRPTSMSYGADPLSTSALKLFVLEGMLSTPA
jgi:hypothetical protein